MLLRDPRASAPCPARLRRLDSGTARLTVRATVKVRCHDSKPFVCWRVSQSCTPHADDAGHNEDAGAPQPSRCRSPFCAACGPPTWAGCGCAAWHPARCAWRAGHHHLGCLAACEAQSTVQPCPRARSSKPIAERLLGVAYTYELDAQLVGQASSALGSSAYGRRARLVYLSARTP